ncbi:MAG: histidine kinase [Kibdelosporangium sp.]
MVLIVLSTAVALTVALGGAFWWRRHVVTGAVTAFIMSIVDTIGYRGPGDNVTAGWLLVETAAQLCVLVQVTRRARNPVAPAALGVVAVGVSPLRIGIWLTPPAPVGEVAAICAVWTLFAAAAVGVGAYLRSLDRRRVQSVDNARREQRLRLAQDLHDWLAHEMTGIVLTAQAGQIDTTDQTATLREIEQAGIRGLDAMDRALGLLRSASDQPSSERTPSLAEVRAVVDRFAATSTAQVTCEMDDQPEPTPEIAATIHRVVVESLTNVRRHAPAASAVQVTVTRTAASVVVEVTDDGGGRLAGRRRNRGTGLAALTEWVRTLGGTLTAGPTQPAGWTVSAAVPS